MGVPRGIAPWYTLGFNTPRYRRAGFVPPWLDKTAEGFYPSDLLDIDIFSYIK